MAFKGSAGFPKLLQSTAISASGETITHINSNINGTGTFRIMYGTAPTIGGTITWEEINTQNSNVELTNPNKVLYYRILGTSGSELYNTGITPAVQIEIISS